MADTIKCTCSHCGAKYRLPVEAQGRNAKCKRCGEKFQVPMQENLEDSILSWLNVPDEEDDLAPAKPRVISMPHDEEESDAEGGPRRRGTIRMRAPTKED